MRKCYELNLDANHLLPIFAGCDIKQPYRLQPYVRVIVSFEEYVKFVKEIMKQNLHVLFFSLNYYKKCLGTGRDDALLNVYYVDMSKAITAELSMACIFGRDCTEICHSFSDSVLVDRDDMDDLLNEVGVDCIKQAAEYVNEDLRNRCGWFRLSDNNRLVYRYAVLLRALSMTSNPKKFTFK